MKRWTTTRIYYELTRAEVAEAIALWLQERNPPVYAEPVSFEEDGSCTWVYEYEEGSDPEDG